MAVVNASSFLLFKDNTVIGHSRETSVNLDLDLPDATTKDSNGWSEVLACVRGGEVTINSLTAYDEVLTFTQFADYLIGKSELTFYLKEQTDPRIIIRGNGYITSVDEIGDSETITEYNLNITLTGAITVTDPTEGKTWENIFEVWETIADEWEEV